MLVAHVNGTYAFHMHIEYNIMCSILTTYMQLIPVLAFSQVWMRDRCVDIMYYASAGGWWVCLFSPFANHRPTISNTNRTLHVCVCTYYARGAWLVFCACVCMCFMIATWLAGKYLHSNWSQLLCGYQHIYNTSPTCKLAPCFVCWLNYYSTIYTYMLCLCACIFKHVKRNGRLIIQFCASAPEISVPTQVIVRVHGVHFVHSHAPCDERSNCLFKNITFNSINLAWRHNRMQTQTCIWIWVGPFWLS